MIESCDFRGAVYILENIDAQRVKVGMTIHHSDVINRHISINRMWNQFKGTCQVCGGRRQLNMKNMIPEHEWSSEECVGGNSLPLERDLSLALIYLTALKDRLSYLSGTEKGSTVRIVNNLEKRIKKYRIVRRVGRWAIAVVFNTDCAGDVETLSHSILMGYLDKAAPFGEVFCCSVAIATNAVESAISQLDLQKTATKETQPL